MIPKHYNFRDTEKKIYQFWLDKGYFASRYDKSGSQKSVKPIKEKGNSLSPFVMVIPPPNVTGRLHMGHALNNTIQDLLIRFHRMRGRDVLWVPGTDHAGIATQTVVKKMLDEQGIDYRSLGRKEFIKHVWKWKDKFGDIILGQLRSLGVSCDWERVCYTMDKGPSRAVTYAFKKLYDNGYIYRAKRIVNWCPIDKTALSDDEVETSEKGESGFLYQIAYRLTESVDNLKELVISTTRPETLFGDVAIAVHPQDKRYYHLVGKKTIVPLSNREIPIIADEYVDPEFGTGCLKVTPAHDPYDFEIGVKHHLPFINIMNEDATLNEETPLAYQGLSREVARKKAILDLEKLQFFRGKKPRMIPIGRSYRSKAVIEYRLSDQWFVKMRPLAKKVLASKELEIYPENYKKLWGHWLNNIRDWCISRQIWWGHRIPAWFNKETGEILVEESEPEEVQKSPEKWQQDEDVLDTWFSSSLWPMSVFGWPENTSDFKRYFPTTALSTAKDIIFFWVARMCLMSLFFENRFPFSHVYFHPTVMDHRGKTMSKSKGNGIDPKHIIDGATVEELKAPILDARPAEMITMIKEIENKYANGFIGVGADALRYTLIFLSSHMQSLQLSLDNFLELGRRFTDKIWNASRFVFMHLEKANDFDLKGLSTTSDYPRRVEDLWMESHCCFAVKQITSAMQRYDFSNLGKIYYELVWNNFCDWYIESIKYRLEDGDKSIQLNAINNMLSIFEKILIILHPLLPFLTEDLYQTLSRRSKKWKVILRSNAPLIHTSFLEEKDYVFLQGAEEKIKEFEIVQDVVNAVRSFKKQNNFKDQDFFAIYYESPNLEPVLDKQKKLITHLANLKEFISYSDKRFEKNNLNFYKIVQSDFILYVKQREKDQKKVLDEIKQTLKRLERDQQFIEKRLSNSGFVKNANHQIVEREKERLKKIKINIKGLKTERNKF